MTLRNIWAFIARWKWVLIPGLLLALVGGGAAFYFTPFTYTVSSSYLFLSPVKDAATGAAGNPLLQLGNGVSVTVDVLSVSLMDDATVRTYTAHAPELKYKAARDTSVLAPLLVISVQDTSLKVAKATLDSLQTELAARLDELQQRAGAPKAQWVTIRELTQDPKPELDFSDPVRNGILVLLVLTLLLLVSVALTDRRRSGRSYDRLQRENSSSEADAERQVGRFIDRFDEPSPTLRGSRQREHVNETSS